MYFNIVKFDKNVLVTILLVALSLTYMSVYLYIFRFSKMAISVYLDLLLTYSVWGFYISLNMLYTIIRGVYWRINGVHTQRIQSKLQKNYIRSAHVKRIIYKRFLDGFMMASELDFVTVHERFDKPECVLGDDCSLYTITRTEAIFVQTQPNWPEHVFRSDFHILGQFYSAAKVITMPLDQFNRLAENMEDDGGKLVIVQNQARCGGTLLTAIFRDTERCVTFNEPHCFTAVCTYILNDNIWHGATARRMYKNTVRMLCKPYRALGDKVLAYVIKPTVLNMPITEMTNYVFPDATQLFMYREPVTVAISLRRIGQVLDTLKLMYHLPNIPNSIAFLIRTIGYTSIAYRNWSCVIHAELEVGFRTACLTTDCYLTAIKHGVDIRGLRYEDLVAYSDNVISEVFELCQLPESLIAKARPALHRDSQENSPISRKKVENAIPVPPKPTPAFMEIARAMAEEFGVPSPEKYADKSFRLPNSLVPCDYIKCL